jgi:hypothetical protein
MKIALYIVLVIVVLCLLGCGKVQLDNHTVYTIKKGQHSSGNHFDTQTSEVLTFEAKFDKSAIYQTVLPSNQYDINKLYGFSDCNQQHHTNSARFGWRWFKDKLEIHAYVYNDGVRKSKFIRSVAIDEMTSYELTIESSYYKFRVGSTVIEMNRTNNCEVGAYYKLYPYFGGDETAPHDIKIVIKEPRER